MERITKSIDSARDSVQGLYRESDNRSSKLATTLENTLARITDWQERTALDPSRVHSANHPLPMTHTGSTDTQPIDIREESTKTKDNTLEIPMDSTDTTAQTTSGQVDIAQKELRIHSEPLSPSPILDRPITERCRDCGKMDNDINRCDHCELPFHTECMLQSPGGT